MGTENANQEKNAIGAPKPPGSVSSTVALAKLHCLLDEYLPIWYTKEQRDRTLCALRLPTQVLAEVSVLLEEYSPTWYPEELRNRTLTALRLPTDVLLELCGLLEDYAPAWYSREHRDRALAALKGLGLIEEEASREEHDVESQGHNLFDRR